MLTLHKTFETSANSKRMGRRETLRMFEVINLHHFSRGSIKVKLV